MVGAAAARRAAAVRVPRRRARAGRGGRARGLEGDLSAVADSSWSARDTTPTEIEAALRELEAARCAEDDGCAPGRALNLVCVVDAACAGEIAHRLDQVGRYHASRTVICAVESGRAAIDARATIGGAPSRPGAPASVRETVTVTVGDRHLPALGSIVDPLVITDVATVAWAPHGHDEAIDALTCGGPGRAPIAQVVLLDSTDAPDPRAGLARASEVAACGYVVDLAWLRTTPWRERLAAAFDPERRRDELRTLAKVSVRHRADSAASGLLLLGWLCSRLDLDPGAVELRLEAVDGMDVPGLAGVEVSTTAGAVLGLERGAGGLTARRREPDGSERTWTVLGASRGEGGILGEGIRQALLRDPAHGPALTVAARLAR